MHYLFRIELDQFYVRQLPPETSTRASVVHKDGVILDACPLASEMKVQPGMGLKEAKAILERGRLVAWEPEPYRAAQEHFLDLCAEYTDVVEPIQQHAVLLNLSMHPRPAAIAHSLMERLSESVSANVRCGAAGCRWLAEVVCAMNMGPGKAVQSPLFVAGLPVHWLTAVSPAIRKHLMRLGYTQIGELQGVSAAALREQFGSHAHVLEQAVRGRGDVIVRAAWPKDCRTARFSFEGPAQEVETLMNGLRQVAQDLASALDIEDLAGHTLELVLEHEFGAPTVLKRNFTRQIQGASTLLTCMRLVLNELPKRAVCAVRARMPHLEKAKRSQRSFERRSTSNPDRAEEALKHIRTVFGDHAIEVASQREIPRRVKVLNVWKEATGWY